MDNGVIIVWIIRVDIAWIMAGDVDIAWIMAGVLRPP